jgi:hypothetical protein
MKKTITYCSFIVSGLIIIFSICMFTIKLDWTRTCYFINSDTTCALIVDKKTNKFVESKSINKCSLTIDEHKYNIYINYDCYDEIGYHYWVEVYDELPSISTNIVCNFGGIVLIQHLI